MASRTITFINEEVIEIIQLHDDALVVTLQIANHNIHQVLIDTESSMDVLLRFTYEQMGLLSAILKLVDTPLYRFSSHNV